MGQVNETFTAGPLLWSMHAVFVCLRAWLVRGGGRVPQWPVLNNGQSMRLTIDTFSDTVSTETHTSSECILREPFRAEAAGLVF